MALGLRRPAERQIAPDPEEAAFSQLFGTLAANPSVQIITVDDLNRYIEVWIRMGDDDEANEFAVSDAVCEYHNSEGVTRPIDLHLLLSHEPESFFPTNLPVMFRRRS